MNRRMPVSGAPVPYCRRTEPGYTLATPWLGGALSLGEHLRLLRRTDGKVTSSGQTTKIEDFKDGIVYDMAMLDDSDSYLLDCVGQRRFGPQLLLTTNPNACPTVAPSRGNFGVTWDASF
jgi:hypothetical protein